MANAIMTATSLGIDQIGKDRPIVRTMAFSAVYLLGVFFSVRITNGQIVYPLDDSYIHMDLARTIASGVWGVQPTDWAAASSSPLFTLILAGLYRVWPTRVLDFTFAPLLANVAAALGLLYIMRSTLVGAVLLFLAAPLVPLTLLGMEHTLDALLALLLILQGIAALHDQKTRYLTVGLLSAAAAFCRYESLVVVLFLCVFAAVARRWRLVFTLALPAALPLLAVGYMWRLHGGGFVPNSLLLKAPLPTGSLLSVLHALASKILRNFHFENLTSALTLTAVMAFTAVLVLSQGLRMMKIGERPTSPALLLGLAAVGSGLVQMTFGSVGWLYRYEAWLLVLNMAACLALMPNIYVVLALAMIFSPRWYHDSSDTWTASQDRLYEHVAPAEFVGQFFPGKTVAVNDVGIMAWISHATVLDLFGLASNEPVKMRKDNAYTMDAVDRWTASRNVQVAILEACWRVISNITPHSWQLVETWHLPSNTVFDDYTVGFYAPTPEAAKTLRRDLAVYSAPPAVGRTSLPEGASRTDIIAALNCH